MLTRFRPLCLVLMMLVGLFVACADPVDAPQMDALRFCWRGQERALDRGSPEAAIAEATLEEALSEVTAASAMVYSDTQFDAKLSDYPLFQVAFLPPRRLSTGHGEISLQRAALVPEIQGMMLLVTPVDFVGWQVYAVRATPGSHHLLASILGAFSGTISAKPGRTAYASPSPTEQEIAAVPNPAEVRLTPSPQAQRDAPLLTWARIRDSDHRCDKLVVWGDGVAQYGSCETDLRQAALPPSALEALQRWGDELAPFSEQRADAEQSVRFDISWFGRGSRQAAPDDVSRMLLWSTRLHHTLGQPAQ